MNRSFPTQLPTTQKSWRKSNRLSKAQIVASLLAAFMAVMSIVYVTLIYRAVAKPLAKIVVVGPTVKAGSVRVDLGPWVDLPGLFCSASASRVARMLHHQSGTGSEPIVSHGRFISDLKLTHSRGIPLIVYYSGIMSVAGDRVGTVDSSDLAQTEAQSNELRELILTIKQSRAPLAVVVIDLVMPDLPGPIALAASHYFERARREIDAALREAGEVPVSVQLSINRIPRWHELGVPSSLDPEKPILPVASTPAQRFVEAIQHFSKQTNAEVHDLQSFFESGVLDSSKPIVYRAQTDWLSSPNWPMNDSFVSFVPWKDNIGQVADGKPSELPSIPDESMSSINASLQSYRDLIIKSNTKSKSPGLEWLSIVETESFASLNPMSHSLLEKNYFMLRAAYELIPEAIDSTSLHSVVESLSSAFLSNPMPDKVPSWVAPFFTTDTKPPCTTVNSLISRAVLSSYGLAHPLDDHEQLWLSRVRTFIDSDDPVTNDVLLAAAQDNLKTSEPNIESRWLATLLARDDLEPTTKRELVHTRMLAFRMISDPLIVAMFQADLMEANASLIKAERTLADQLIPDWKSVSLHYIQDAKKRYESIHSHYQLARSQQSKLRTWIQSELVNLDHFSFPAPQLEPDGGVADDSVVLSKYQQIWLELQSRIADLHSLQDSVEIRTNERSLLSFESTYTDRVKAIDFQVEADKLLQLLKAAELRVSRSGSIELPYLNEFLREAFASILREETDSDSVVSVFDPKQMLRKLIEFNQQRILMEANGAETWEAELLTSQSLSWERLSKKLNLKSSSSFHDHFRNAIRIENPQRLDFGSKEQSDGYLSLEIDHDESSKIEVMSEYNNELLEFELNGTSLASGRSMLVDIPSGKQKRIKLPISARKVGPHHESSPVILYVSHGTQSRRTTMGVEPASLPMLELRLNNSIDLTDSSGSLNTESSNRDLNPRTIDACLFGNKLNPFSILVRNLDSREMLFSHRILLNQSESSFPTAGVLNQLKAKQLVGSFGGLSHVATSISRALRAGQNEAIRFLPSPELAKITDPSFRELVIESTNETTSQVQFTIVKAKALHPNRFMTASAVVHADSQTLDVIFSSTHRSGIPPQGVLVQCELWELDNGRLIGTPQCILDQSGQSKTIRMSVAGSQTKSFLINVAVDGWRSAFVLEVDGNRSGVYEPNSHFVGAAIHAIGKTTIVPVNATSFDVEMDLCINEATFDPRRDRIVIGIDRNLDRTLDGESAVEFCETKNHRAFFRGVDDNGEMVLESRIEPIKASLPVELEWDRKGPVLAKMVRAGETIYFNGPELTFDKKKPEIRHITIQSSTPLILGKPLTVTIITDDAELAGVSLVEGGWSVTGEADFHDRMLIIPGTSNQVNRWSLTLPTDSLLPGTNLLLIRARDRSGNTSETYSLPCLTMTEADYQKTSNAAVTIIRGKLLSPINLLPGAQLKLGLEREPAIEKTSGEAAPEAELKIIATTTADEGGSFLFSNVPSGKYVVESNVILRGTRIIQRTPVVVDALTGPSDCSITVGKQK